MIAISAGSALALGLTALTAAVSFSPAQAAPAPVAGPRFLGQPARPFYAPRQHYGQQGCVTVARLVNGRRILHRLCP